MGIRDILSSNAVVDGAGFADRRALVLSCRSIPESRTRAIVLLQDHKDGAAP